MYNKVVIFLHFWEIIVKYGTAIVSLQLKFLVWYKLAQ